MSSLTRLVAVLYLPFALLVIAGGAFTYSGEVHRELEHYKTQEATEVALGVASIENNIDSLRDDVLFLSQLPSVRAALESPLETSFSPAVEILLAMARTRSEYQQVRWLDELGMERIRVENGEGRSKVIQPSSLQNKAERYYFTEAMALGAGNIYVSPLDLNVENGKVEVPYRPMIRVSTPVFSRAGKRRGVLVLNFSGKKLIADLERQFSGSALDHTILLSAEGYWLRSSRSEDEWGFMFGREETYAHRYPAEWARISAANNGQFLNDRGLTTFKNLHLPWSVALPHKDGGSRGKAGASADSMIVVSFVSNQELRNNMLNAKLKIWGAAVLLLCIGLVGSWFLARTWLSRQRAQAELDRTKDRNTLLAGLGEGVIGLDVDFRCVVANAMACKLLDVSENALVGEGIGTLVNWSQSKITDTHVTLSPLTLAIESIANGNMTFDSFGWIRTRSGKVFPSWISMTPATDNDGGIAFVLAIQDITELKQAEAEAYSLAYFHQLTNLPNRRMLLDRLGIAASNAARTKECIALLFIDLDHFKVINEVFGREIGDRVLVTIADYLRSHVRAEDTLAHFGSDHFVAMLTNLPRNPEAALSASAKVADEIASRITHDISAVEGQHSVTVSIGISLMCGKEKLAPAELLERAELAMHQAKEAGRNSVRFFDPAMQAQLEARVRLESEIRDGLARGEFEAYYQPKINPKGEMVAVEALARWNHPHHGLVSPAEFIPVAEASGLILILGVQMIEHACRQLAAWTMDEQYQRVSIAVNVSAKQFRNPTFVSEVADMLAVTNAPGNRLMIELTESVLVDDLAQVVLKMDTLKAHGIRFSLDDFGTGYSSLSYLKRLPFSQVKIDRSFVSDMLVDTNSTALVRTIIAMAKSLGLETVAEGVETQEQWESLIKEGCDQGQGYWLGRPAPIQVLTKG